MQKTLIQISAGQGPDECCLAVAKAYHAMRIDAARHGVVLHELELCAGEREQGFRSVLLQMEVEGGQDKSKVQDFLHRWCGTCQWICASLYRPQHKRKNWFFSVRLFMLNETLQDSAIRYESCRASGPGGQHVNKSDSAVRATHLSSGLQVKVQTERSQLANKRLAKLLLEQKLLEMAQKEQAHAQQERHLTHYALERGDADHVFRDLRFVRVSK